MPDHDDCPQDDIYAVFEEEDCPYLDDWDAWLGDAL